MSNVQDYKRLRDKFLQAELDYEDRESPYKMTLKDFKRLEDESKSIKRKSLFEFHLTKRFLKLHMLYLQTFLTALGTVFSALWTKTESFFKKIYRTYLIHRERAEFVFDTKLTELEERQKSKEKMNDVAKNEVQEFVLDYEKELQGLFSGVRCTFSMADESRKAKVIKPNLDFHQNIYDIILKKMTDSRMILNIEEINVSLKLEDELVKNTIVFKLKSKGDVWGKLFAKYIMTSLYKKIEIYDGKMSAKHEFNVTKKEDVFFLGFEHCRLLSYVESSDHIYGDRVLQNKEKKGVSQKIPLKEIGA